MRLTLLSAFVLGSVAVSPAIPAAALELGLPLACRPGEDCWVVRLPDHDPGPGFTDHACGKLGSDGHDGTDFAIRDPQRMTEGVPVIAAAAGRVRAVREGEPDQPADGRLTIDYGDRNCGNGVVVEHDDGWSTQYCHLRQGSVTARTGGSVAAGEPLGMVGMSGEANFPHVHITVRREDTVIDPYTGSADDVACGGEARPLWRPDLHEALRYRPVAIAAVGLAGEVPEHADIVSGTVDDEPVRTDGSALVGYVLAYGLGRGDRVLLRITAPSGQPVAELTSVVEREAPRATRSGGKRTPAGGWPAGTYTVEATVEREEERFMAERRVELAQ